MNQMDTAATPMYGAFTGKPDFTSYKAVPNQTSLTLGYATEPSCGWNVPAPANAAYAGRGGPQDVPGGSLAPQGGDS
jgi:hypothetical protein